jgi:hypothetical protein
MREYSAFVWMNEKEVKNIVRHALRKVTNNIYHSSTKVHPSSFGSGALFSDGQSESEYELVRPKFSKDFTFSDSVVSVNRERLGLKDSRHSSALELESNDVITKLWCLIINPLF